MAQALERDYIPKVMASSDLGIDLLLLQFAYDTSELHVS